MESIRISTTSGVFRSLDLAPYATITDPGDSDYDAAPKTLSGKVTTFARRRRKKATIKVDYMPAEDLRALRAIKAARQTVRLEANVGEESCVYAPMQRGIQNILGSVAIFSRTTPATYLDRDGNIIEVASGVKRFEPCKLGTGILLEPERVNYLFPSHPADGVLSWSSGAGSPTLAWDASFLSIMTDSGGSLRVDAGSGESITKAVTVTNTNDYSAQVYVRGMGSVTLSATGASGVTPHELTLSGEWQRLIVEGMTATGTTITLSVTASEASTLFWVAGAQLEEGMTVSSYILAASEATTRDQDEVYYLLPSLSYLAGSISFFFRFPRIDAGGENRVLFYVNSNFYIQVSASGAILFSFGSGLSVHESGHGYTEGDIVHLAAVWKDDYTALILDGVEVDSSSDNTRLSGSPAGGYLYHSTDAARSPGTVVEDFRVDRVFVEWRVSEGGEYLPYTDAANLEERKRTAAREFKISQGSFIPQEGEPGFFKGGFVLTEIDSNEDNTVEEA